MIYTVQEVADKLRISAKTCYQLIEDGSLKCVRVRGSIRITQNAIDEFISQGGTQKHERPSN